MHRASSKSSQGVESPRHKWSVEERLRIVTASLKKGTTVDAVAKVSRKSDIAGAIGYAFGRWPALLHYCDDGSLEIDNNAAKRALRAVALGRKKLLFCRIGLWRERAAAMQSLIGSAKLNGLDPEAYLRHVLARIADDLINRVAELLPRNIEFSAPRTLPDAAFR